MSASRTGHLQAEDSKAVAYRVTCGGYDAVTFATSEAQARFNAVHAFREAGYGGRREWPSGVGARRAPQFDRSVFRDPRRPRAVYREDAL